MTTYPLSEPATIRRNAGGVKASNGNDEVIGRGSLADCADILEATSAEERSSLQIDIDDMGLHYGPKEIEELLTYFRDESAGLSNHEISDIEELNR